MLVGDRPRHDRDVHAGTASDESRRRLLFHSTRESKAPDGPLSNPILAFDRGLSGPHGQVIDPFSNARNDVTRGKIAEPDPNRTLLEVDDKPAIAAGLDDPFVLPVTAAVVVHQDLHPGAWNDFIGPLDLDRPREPARECRLGWAPAAWIGSAWFPPGHPAGARAEPHAAETSHGQENNQGCDFELVPKHGIQNSRARAAAALPDVNPSAMRMVDWTRFPERPPGSGLPRLRPAAAPGPSTGRV